MSDYDTSVIVQFYFSIIVHRFGFIEDENKDCFRCFIEIQITNFPDKIGCENLRLFINYTLRRLIWIIYISRCKYHQIYLKFISVVNIFLFIYYLFIFFFCHVIDSENNENA